MPVCGTRLGRDKKYDEAVKAFLRVDSGYKDGDIRLVQNRKQLAEVHYLRGVKLFIDEEIESAIEEWEATLTLEPAHANAKKDIQNGRNLLQNLKGSNNRVGKEGCHIKSEPDFPNFTSDPRFPSGISKSFLKNSST